MRRPNFFVPAILVVLFGAAIANTNWHASGQPPRLTAFGETAQADDVESSVYYRRCADARAAGAAPIYAGEPGYREGLDADGDGIACEPYHPR